MTAEAKMRTLAAADTALRAFFFNGANGTFRWFDRQLPPGYISTGTCARVRRISTVRDYSHSGLLKLSRPRFQVDVLDADPEVARQATAAIIDWLGRVDFAGNAQFDSPPTTPRQFPNFVLSQRSGLEPRTNQPKETPLAVETLDFRIFNQEP